MALNLNNIAVPVQAWVGTGSFAAELRFGMHV
jgi:hypothetical protein